MMRFTPEDQEIVNACVWAALDSGAATDVEALMDLALDEVGYWSPFTGAERVYVRRVAEKAIETLAV